ncbi:MAG: twin-arginine translocase TatA/TatE family subunit [Bacteroidia bacterium]
MFGLGTSELILIFLALLLLFGAKRIPELARGIGKGIFEFRKAMRGEESSPTPPPTRQKELE